MIISKLTLKILINLKQRKNKGFTLIELLVVVIIIGVLATVALPNLLEQVQKSRQTEAKINLGAINRAQQANRFETGTFTNISNLDTLVTGKYYIYADNGTPDGQGAIHIATVVGNFQNEIRDYSSAVGQVSSGAYTGVICEQNTIDAAIPPIPPTVTAGVPACTSGTTIVF